MDCAWFGQARAGAALKTTSVASAAEIASIVKAVVKESATDCTHARPVLSEEEVRRLL